MKHNYLIEGYGYCLRPVTLEDAGFIVDIRLNDTNRSRYIHRISPDVSVQEKWLLEYFKRKGDYYFVIENRYTRRAEGLISVYNTDLDRAEWGRWILTKSSMASLESVDLIYRIAFEKLGLKELYCRTVEDNKEVVTFHSAIGELTHKVLYDHFVIDDKHYNAVEQYANREHFYNVMHPVLESKSIMIAQRNFRQLVGRFELHHIGVASKNIEKDFAAYALLGYKKEGVSFKDFQQGIRGLFITAKGQPRLELLENLEGSDTLGLYLNSNTKMYHNAYLVDNIEKTLKVLLNSRAKIISPLKDAAYFGKRICFVMLTNMTLVELVEV